MRNYILLFLLPALLISNSCSDKKYRYIIRLDEIPFSQINNYYGSPKRNMSFTEDSIRMNRHTFKYGLGTHAPSDLRIPVNRQDLIFEAIIGIDTGAGIDSCILTRGNFTPDYIYDNNENLTTNDRGGTAVFRVFADDRMIFESPVMNRKSKPLKIKLKIKNTRTLKLVTDPNDDGSFADHTNWAVAGLRFREDLHPSSFFIYSTAEKIMLNQSGYKPESHKKCVIPADVIDSLYIYCSQTDKLVFKCTIDLIPGDMGKYLTADFSEFRETGKYYLYSAGLRSNEFEISEHILKNQIRMHLEYIDSLSNIKSILKNNPVIGKRSDDGNLQEVNLGWYDMYESCWSVHSSVQLLYSLSVLKELNHENSIDSLLTRWIAFGNRFLFSMLAPEGYLMHSVDFAGSCIENDRNNKDNSTDNILINTYPSSFSTQFLFSLTEAKIARLSGNKHEATQCKRVAEDCFLRASSHFSGKNICELGIAIGAACELYKLNKSTVYKKLAEKYTDSLLTQIDYQPESSAEHDLELFSRLQGITEKGCSASQTIAGLCMFVNTFGESPLIPSCVDIISNIYCKNITFLANRNAYNLVPRFIYDQKVEGSRNTEDHYYSLFDPVINSHPGKGNTSYITSTAAVLIMIAGTFNKPELVDIAQNQLDWVLGCNPFSLSFVSASGSRHPAIYKGGSIPLSAKGIKGGVMTGISSDLNDSPAVYPGWKQTTGYCIESLANILWLEALLDK